MWVSRHQKGKTSLDLNEARDDGVLGCSGIRWTIFKQSAPHPRQTTTPTCHHSGRMLFLTTNQQCQSTDWTTVEINIMIVLYWSSVQTTGLFKTAQGTPVWTHKRRTSMQRMQRSIENERLKTHACLHGSYCAVSLWKLCTRMSKKYAKQNN